ncbi:MAG: hypothetical protein HY885_08640 [Deltaproteobacteria bacterium]|nr:hypothetical protein [Deltaproteobacteria bacterium]
MSACNHCSEFMSENSLCPICGFKILLEKYRSDIAYPVLDVADKVFGGPLTGNYLTIERATELIQHMLSLANNIVKLKNPREAITVATGKIEDITPITLNILKKNWIHFSYCIQDFCSMVMHSLPEIGVNQAYSELFKLGFKQIGRSYQSEYMVSVQSFFRFPIYMQTIGFEKVVKTDLINVDLEITSGYYSYLRNDMLPIKSGVCVHTTPIDLNFKPNWQFRRKNVQFALSNYKSSHEVAHFIGPEIDLFMLLEDLLTDSAYYSFNPGSTTTDVIDAVITWCKDKSRLTFNPIKPGIGQ